MFNVLHDLLNSLTTCISFKLLNSVFTLPGVTIAIGVTIVILKDEVRADEAVDRKGVLLVRGRVVSILVST